MRDSPIEVLDAWVENDRMLFVYECSDGITFGLDRGWDSPIGTPDASDDELAQEIARYCIMELRVACALRQPITGYLYWWGKSSAYLRKPCLSSVASEVFPTTGSRNEARATGAAAGS